MMIYIRQRLIFFILLIVIFICGCNAEKPPFEAALTKLNLEHNTVDAMQNLNNGSLVCGVDNWLFFVDEERREICRVKHDGTGLSTLRNFGANDVDRLQISGNWLYYFEYNEPEWDDYIRRIDLNGTKTEQLEGMNLIDFWAVDKDSIYSIKGSKYFIKNNYCRETGGSSTVLKISSFDKDAFLSDGALYYTNRESYEGLTKTLYKVDLDNLDSPQVIGSIDKEASKLIVKGEYLYYLSKQNNNLYRVPINGAGNKKAQSIGEGYTAVILKDDSILTSNNYTLTWTSIKKGIKHNILSYPEDSVTGPYIVNSEIYVLIGSNDIESVHAEHCKLEHVAGTLYRITLTN